MKAKVIKFWLDDIACQRLWAPGLSPFIWKGINLGWSRSSTTLKLSFREYDGLKKKRKERKKTESLFLYSVTSSPFDSKCYSAHIWEIMHLKKLIPFIFCGEEFNIWFTGLTWKPCPGYKKTPKSRRHCSYTQEMCHLIIQGEKFMINV